MSLAARQIAAGGAALAAIALLLTACADGYQGGSSAGAPAAASTGTPTSAPAASAATEVEAAYAAARACIEAPLAPDAQGPAATETSDSPLAVATGHGYGSHKGTNVGLYPPLLPVLDALAGSADVLFLTGDIARNGAADEFAEVGQETAAWPTVLVAPGNHDVSEPERRAAFTQAFGPTYGSQRIGSTLVIRLDTELDDWRIAGDQLDWLRSTLASPEAQGAASVVVLTHHLIWAPDNGAAQPVNGGPHAAAAPRDPNQLGDLFASVDVPVVVVSGDTGAFADRPSLACEDRGGIRYVASGVGGGAQDSVLVMRLGAQPRIAVCRLGVDDPNDCVERATG